MGEAFWKSPMGKKFFEVTIPRIADGIERLVEAIERQNKLLERQARTQKTETPPPPPDSLKELTGTFIGGSMKFRGDEFRTVGRAYIETVLRKWTNELPTAMASKKICGELVEVVVRLVSLSCKNGEVNEEGIEAGICRWIQSTAFLETDGRAHRELQRLVMGLCKDAVAGSLVVQG